MQENSPENEPNEKPDASAQFADAQQNHEDAPKAGGRLRRGPAALRERLAKKAAERQGNRKPFPAERAKRPQAQSLAPEADEGFAFDDVVAGRLDAENDNPAEQVRQQHKRVLQPDAEQPKLHKVLAQAGMGSRLEMEQLILEGRITVNNAPAHVGQRVQYGDQVKVNGKPIRFRIAPPPVRVLAYHKPVGEVVTRDDPQSRPTVFRKLPRLHQGKWQAVGRLDLNTEGLLLFTNSGDLANRLMHPRFGLEREYAVRVLGALSDEEKQRLLEGVRLEDGDAAFSSIQDGGGEGVNQWYKVTISEGRNREVRRMMEAVGHAVSRLIRIRYGSVPLMRGLHRGMWLDLSERDVQRLMQESGMVPVQPSGERTGSARNGQRGSAARARSQGFVPPGSAGGKRPAARSAKPTGAATGTSRAGNGAGRSKPGQPDPMKTSLGYIGQDSINQYRQKQKRQNRR